MMERRKVYKMAVEKPLVSIYIPTHNRYRLLERTLLSVLTQTYENIEIIVVDDGSSDRTESFMQDFVRKHPNVRYLKHEKPKGANAARNLAISEANGFFVTGFDDDDEMYPDRIEKMVNAYDDRYAFVSTGFQTKSTEKGIGTYIPPKAEYTLQDALARNCSGNTVLSTKEMYVKAGLFDEKLVGCQDYDMWIRMLEIKPFAKAIQEPLCLMHHDHERISNTKKRLKGDMQWFFKHKHKLTKKRRKNLITSFRFRKGKKAKTIKMFFAFYPWDQNKRALRNMIKKIFKI